MKTKKFSLGMAMLMVAMSVLFTDCRKKEKTDPIEPDNESASAADNALAEGTMSDVQAIGSQLSENSGTLTTYKLADNNMMFGCATVSSNATGTVPATQYTIDFGTGCQGQDYRVRKGKLIFDFSQSTNGAKWYRNPGFKMTVTSSGYTVDDHQVNITNKTVSNTTPTNVIGQTSYNGTNLTWSVTASVNIVKANNGGTVSWSCNRTKELINSNDPLCYKGQLQAIDWTKAKIKINGSAGGTNARGENYSATATNLERHFTCTPNASQPHRHPFVAGTVLYKPGSRAERLINYGNGECDFNATVLINGQTFTISVQ